MLVACVPGFVLWVGARECALVFGVGEEVLGIGVLLCVPIIYLIADRPGLCGVHIVCAAIRSTAVRIKVSVHCFAREIWCAGWAVRAPLDGRLACAAFARGVATRASAGAAARARIPVKDS